MAAGDVTRRASITAPSMHRRPSARRGSLIKNPQSASQEVPWDIIDRCALPIVLCHALAVVLSALLNALHISQVSVFTLFLWFAISVTGSLWFYHNLQENVIPSRSSRSDRDNVPTSNGVNNYRGLSAEAASAARSMCHASSPHHGWHDLTRCVDLVKSSLWK